MKHLLTKGCRVFTFCNTDSHSICVIENVLHIFEHRKKQTYILNI